MQRTPQRDRLTQLGLFWERVTTPRWCNLSESTHDEITRLLAQLLREARARKPAAHRQGAGDE